MGLNMPKWKYLVTGHFGTARQRQETAQRILHAVQNRGLSSFLPQVKYEAGRRGEYYIGLAGDIRYEHENTVERWCREILAEAGITRALNEQISFWLEADQVATLLRGQMDYESFTEPIKYTTPSQSSEIHPDDLYSITSDSDLSLRNSSSSDSFDFDKLLWWSSANVSGSIGRFKHVCELLGINIEWGGAWSLIRKFTLLGHFEFEKTQTIKWSVSKPVIVKLAASEQSSTYFLAGQRSPNLIEALRWKYVVTEETQPESPTRILIQNIHENEDLDVNKEFKIINTGCVSKELSVLLPTLNEWIEKLPIWDEKEFDKYIIDMYDVNSDSFTRIDYMQEPANGLYRFEVDINGRKIITTTYYLDDIKKWICGDFYGLRYIARSRNKPCHVYYNQDKSEMLVPKCDRWPLPYERAIMLASGRCPNQYLWENELPVLGYTEVDEDIVDSLCQKLELNKEVI